jgi:hypothetical protein
MEMSADFTYPNPGTPGSFPSKVHIRDNSASPEISILSGETPSIPSTPLAKDIVGNMAQPSCSKYPYSPIYTVNASATVTNTVDDQLKNHPDKKTKVKKRWGILGGFRSNR